MQPQKITPTTTRDQDEAAVRDAVRAINASPQGAAQATAQAAHAQLVQAYREKWGGVPPGVATVTDPYEARPLGRVQFPWRAYPTSVPGIK
ncbi:MAG: hypothetical protein JNJ71_10870 [Rubrivivax sp.]|nr:hypothetical protein [Rubrivivax sp.]